VNRRGGAVVALAGRCIGGQAFQPDLVNAGAAVVGADEAEVAQLLQARQVLGDGAARPTALVRQRIDAAKAMLPLLAGVHAHGEQHRAAGAVQAVAMQDAAHQVDVDELLPWRGHGRAGVSHDWLLLNRSKPATTPTPIGGGQTRAGLAYRQEGTGEPCGSPARPPKKGTRTQRVKH